MRLLLSAALAFGLLTSARVASAEITVFTCHFPEFQGAATFITIYDDGSPSRVGVEVGVGSKAKRTPIRQRSDHSCRIQRRRPSHYVDHHQSGRQSRSQSAFAIAAEWVVFAVAIRRPMRPARNPLAPRLTITSSGRRPMPAAWDAAALTFQASIDDSAWVNVVAGAGVETTLQVGSGQLYRLIHGCSAA